MQIKSYAKISLILLLSVPFLPSCFKNDEKRAEGKTVIVVNGKPALTESELEDFITLAVEANPQAKVMYTMMPEAMKEQALEAKKQSITISEWAKRNGVRDSAEYKKKFNQVMDSVYNALDQEEFLKRQKGNVTDQDVVTYYEQHKNDPQFMVSEGGIKTIGIEFNTKDEAEKFAQSLKGKEATAQKMADAKKLKTKDFGLISKDTFVAKYVKSAVENASKFPAVKVVQGDKKFWVIVALSKDDAKYYQLDEVKEGVKRMLEAQQSQEGFQQSIQKYQDEYKIAVDENYKNDLKASLEKRQQDMQAQMQNQQQPAAQAPAVRSGNVA